MICWVSDYVGSTDKSLIPKLRTRGVWSRGAWGAYSPAYLKQGGAYAPSKYAQPGF